MGTWLMHILGLDNASGVPYLAWSGPVGALGSFTIVGGVFAAWRKHTCHVRGCWRFGIHPAADGLYRTCRKHHPAVPNRVTAEHIAEAHEQATRAEQ